MSGFRNFAVAGAGGIGTFIVEELLKAKAAGTVDRIVILTRHESTGREALQKLAEVGAEVVAVDYADANALKQALTGTDVFISALPFAALQVVEPAVAQACKAAGGKLWIPASYGHPAMGERLRGDMQIEKDKYNGIGLPYALFLCGIWSDIMFMDDHWAPLLGLHIPSGKVTIGGDGSKPFTVTTRRDVARYMVYALTQLPTKMLQYKEFQLDGDTKSFNEIFDAYEAKTGKKLEVAHRSVEELEATTAANPYNFAAHQQIVLSSGKAIFDTPDNTLFPDWNPTPTIDLLY
ncbi:NAD-P-binding protein [Artomyces pyxidatus]|uniref:NAD-P-binding protein n=1 Tax=Artomyces pyxidatus TaxID=48021 RepID=A0ACB8TGT2_9AGAM|nr:NAD-P-binding protein [Artomyces pyxidatus]